MKAFVLVLLLASGLGWPAAALAQSASSGGGPRLAPSPFAPNPFLGGVPSGTASASQLPLGIGDAIARALDHNLGVLTSEDAMGQARGARWLALSQMLPNVGGRVTEVRQKVNLAVFGFPLPEGVPTLVGPFNVFDARLHVSQSVFDLRALNELRAQDHIVEASRFSYKSARDLVVLVAANGYLQALATGARAESARAQLQTAEALHAQALDLKKAGVVAGIDVLRAEVQVNTGRQRVTAAQNDFDKARLQLARLIGLPPGQAITLTDQLPFAPVPDMTLEAALARAAGARPDYQAAVERLKAAEASRAAAIGDALPSVHVNADIGTIGLTPSDAQKTYSLAGVVNIPIFQGGRLQGRLQLADTEIRQRKAELEDLKAAIDYDVRTAFLDLQAGREQLDVATAARSLAAQQLTQSRDRFSAGVASHIEVVQAQEAVALASEQYIAGLYSFNVAKAELARALGIAEQAAQQYLGGAR